VSRQSWTQVINQHWSSCKEGQYLMSFIKAAVRSPFLVPDMTNCAIFIDGGYFTKVIENYFNRSKISYQRLSDHLSHDTPRLRTYWYDCMPYQSNPPKPEESAKHAAKAKFFHAVTRQVQRFQLRLGRLRKRGDGSFEQKRVDVLLGIDMVRLCSKKQIDLVILIAGDADLVPAVEACKEEGSIVRLYYKTGNVSDELLNVCDERYEIDQSLVDSLKDLNVGS
jgi:uncharacterized LabA/DUF88 family protein